jgi:ABC-2 type transport system permease protein
LLIAVVAYRKFNFQQFASQKAGSNTKKQPPITLVAAQQLSIQALALPVIDYGHTRWQQLVMSWRLSASDFRYIVFSWPFVSILVAGFLLVYFQQVNMNPMYGFELLPTTERMLRVPMFIFSFVLNLLTFLYMGVLLYRASLSRMDALIDTVPQPDWVLLLSRLWAVFRMQFLLLTLIALGGLITQAIKGYYHFELWHYAFELYILQLVHFMIWACLAMFVHTLFKNMYLSFFLLLLTPLAATGLNEVGKFMNWSFLSENILQFNAVPGFVVGFDYSAFDQYGSTLAVFFAFKAYWLALAIIFLLLALLWWKRGLTFSWAERWSVVKSRYQGALAHWTIIALVVFLSLGSTLYYQTHDVDPISFTQEDEEAISAHNEKNYGHLVQTIQPKLVSADIQLNLYPESRDYQANGQLFFVNKVAQAIDTILVARSFKEITTYEISQAHRILSKDSLMHFDVLLLDESLKTGDTLRLDFSMRNYPNTLLHNNSRVRTNGTFILANILPQLGVRNAFLRNPEKRAKYGLGERIVPDQLPTDTSLLGYTFADNTMDWIYYNTIISTAADQQAFSMGTLKSSWFEGERRYFHYQSDGPISNTISWMSGRYVKQLDEAAGTTIELYHEATHPTYEQLLQGLKASLEYCGDHFGKLQFDTVRLVEYPQTAGTYATVNGNLIPYSEALFLCDVDHEKNDVFNFPFFVSAHEMAHAWWGHRVDPAHVRGGKLVTEALADYLAIKISEKEFGKERARQILGNFHRLYLSQRASEGKESPLIIAGLEQDYLNYRKGSLAFYALSEYLGEAELNAILAHYERVKRNAPPPYPTSLDLLDTIAAIVPDSLQYVLYDLFETITLYDNSINEVKITPLKNGKYQLDIDFSIRKFRSDTNGKLYYADDELVGGEYVRSWVRSQETTDIKLVGSCISEGSSAAKLPTAGIRTLDIGSGVTNSRQRTSLVWKGKQSLPLQDYIRFAFFKKGNDRELASQLHQETVKVTQINNQLRLILNKRPDHIILDPDYMLIDSERQDNEWEE